MCLPAMQPGSYPRDACTPLHATPGAEYPDSRKWHLLEQTFLVCFCCHLIITRASFLSISYENDGQHHCLGFQMYLFIKMFIPHFSPWLKVVNNNQILLIKTRDSNTSKPLSPHPKMLTIHTPQKPWQTNKVYKLKGIKSFFAAGNILPQRIFHPYL